MGLLGRRGEGRIALANQYCHALRLDRRGKVVSEDFSPARRTGVETRRVTLNDGDLFVLEGLDILPAPKRTALLSGLANLTRFGSQKDGRSGILDISRALVLFRGGASPEDEFGQKSFQSVLKVFGLNPDIRDVGETRHLPLDRYDLVVIPPGDLRYLKRPEINSVWDYVSGGGSLVLDGPSTLAEALGLRFEAEPIGVREVKELTLPAQTLAWNPPAVVQPLADDNLTILAKDADSGAVLAGVKQLGKGKVLGFAAPFDPYTPFGISRLPYAPFYLKDALGVSFNVRRNALEFYFDPGLRQNVSWEKLVAAWKASGVKIVYLAAWHFYKTYQFDYAPFYQALP